MKRHDREARICVPVCARRASELAHAATRAATVADIVELRLDCLDEDQLDASVRPIVELVSKHRQPLILTLRPRAEGGRRELTLDERARFWSDTMRSSLAAPSHEELLFDIELDLLTERAMDVRVADWHRVICSFHDFDGVPANLDAVYERMAATRAHILKIAVRAACATDCIAVFRLLARARREGREMIAVAMGEAGTATRLLAPARGAYLTFGALDDARRSAPGQLTATEMRRLYRVASISERTAVYGLVGRPVAHSLSPHMHNAAFAARSTDAVYLPFEVRDPAEFLRRMAHPQTRELDWNLRGLSVTAPHKSALVPALDWIEPSAAEIGAVNTVVVRDDALHGYNTDAAASLAPLEGRMELEGARVAVIGAGGATRALLWSLRARGARATVFARDAARARETAERFDARIAALDGARFGAFDAVVNATPLGTRGAGEEQTPASAEQLRGARFVYDLVYNPSETRLLREARAAGCETIGGLAMLVAQAAAQFKLWTGGDAPLDAMRDAARAALAARDDAANAPSSS